MDSQVIDNIVDEILKKIPKPNFNEIPTLYTDLDNMSKEIVQILAKYEILDLNNMLVRFDITNENTIRELILEKPNTMIPFFVMICGFSERELKRLYKINNVYQLKNKSQIEKFAKIVKEYLTYSYSLETVIYKFYKNWEEHQKRHYRGRRAEEIVKQILEENNIRGGKIKIVCEDKEREIDFAIPPDSRNIQVAIMVRRGVFRDLVKRAKEFSSEFDEILKCYPNIKFVVVYLVDPSEINRVNEIREKIEAERRDRRPYDLVILTEDELRNLPKKLLEEWRVLT